MIGTMNDHAFYQQLLSQQQLQQLQQQHDLTTISQPQFSSYSELGLNLYGLAPTSTSPLSSSGTQHTHSANSTPPLSQDTNKDHRPSTIASNAVSTTAQILDTSQNLGHPYQNQLQLQTVSEIKHCSVCPFLFSVLTLSLSLHT
jgi:hypothetical protein